MSLLTCQEVSFSYEGNEVVKNLNFEVQEGNYLCIVGENGAGKSTLMTGLLGLKAPSSGKILTGEELRSDEIGYLPQQTVQQKDFPASVYEVVLSGRLNSRGFRPFYSKEDKRAAREKLELWGITDLERECYRNLSGGQQQRVLLARALCATKKLLLLDEPVTGLDPVMTRDFYQLIRRINQEEHITIIMVSHDVKEAVDYASHVLHLEKNRVFFGTREEYQNSEYGKLFMGGERHV